MPNPFHSSFELFGQIIESALLEHTPQPDQIKCKVLDLSQEEAICLVWADGYEVYSSFPRFILTNKNLKEGDYFNWNQSTSPRGKPLIGDDEIEPISNPEELTETEKEELDQLWKEFEESKESWDWEEVKEGNS